MYALSNCHIYTGVHQLFSHAIIIKDRKIAHILSQDCLPAGIPQINLQGLSVAPGFIDIQVNGGGDCLFSDQPTVQSIRQISKAHLHFGTTNFMPVLLSATPRKTYAAVEAARYCMSNKLCGVLGLHMEGPFINPEKPGVHELRYIRELTKKELAVLLQAAETRVLRLLTVAPEAVPPEYLRKLAGAGVMLAAGHSLINYEDALASFANGVTCVTHLFNAMSQLHSRAPGLAGAALNERAVWAGIIADGKHVHYANLTLAYRLKGRKLFLVTDAMPPVGGSVRQFMLGGRLVRCLGGRCTTEDGTLAGSALNMAIAVRNCVRYGKIPLAEALRMASTNVAEFLGIDEEYGYISPGYSANLVFFADEVEVQGVVANGKYSFC